VEPVVIEIAAAPRAPVEEVDLLEIPESLRRT
jgi:hypothetical protein